MLVLSRCAVCEVTHTVDSIHFKGGKCHCCKSETHDIIYTAKNANELWLLKKNLKKGLKFAKVELIEKK